MLMNTGRAMPQPSCTRVCISPYICLRLASSRSPRAATRSWSNFSFFQALSFQVESDLKNKVNSTSALGLGLMLPMVSGCFIQTFDQHPLHVDVEADLLGRLLDQHRLVEHGAARHGVQWDCGVADVRALQMELC